MEIWVQGGIKTKDVKFLNVKEQIVDVLFWIVIFEFH